MSAFSKQDQLKWLILDEAGAIQGSGHALWAAEQVFPGSSAAEEADTAFRALRELHEEGLIFFFKMTHHGWDLVPADVAPEQRLTWKEVESDLFHDLHEPNARPFDPEVDLVVFFGATEKGEERYRSLPPEAFPQTEGAISRVESDQPKGA